MPIRYSTESFADILGQRNWFKSFYFKFSNLILLKNQTINNVISRWISRKKGHLHILDAGFGFGAIFDLFYKNRKKMSVLGIDKNEKLIAATNQYIFRNGVQNIYCKTLDVNELNENSAFDLCLSINLLNYVENDELVIKNFYNSLKKGGMLFIFNSSEFVNQSDVNINKGSYHDNIYRKGYSISEISEKLKKSGFSKLRIRYAYGKFGIVSWWISTGLPTKLINLSIFFYLIMPLYALMATPFVLILNYLDIRIEHKKGKCLVVRAIK